MSCRDAGAQVEHSKMQRHVHSHLTSMLHMQTGGSGGAAQVAQLLQDRGVQLELVVDEVREHSLAHDVCMQGHCSCIDQAQMVEGASACQLWVVVLVAHRTGLLAAGWYHSEGRPQGVHHYSYCSGWHRREGKLMPCLAALYAVIRRVRACVFRAGKSKAGSWGHRWVSQLHQLCGT